MGAALRGTNWIKELFLRFGFIVKRSNYYSREDLRLLRYLELNEIDTVLDVGANRGEYAAALIRGGFRGRIYSFEALPDLYDGLAERAAATSDRWIVAPRCAISDREGAAKFNITRAESSSSLLTPTGVAVDMPGIFSIERTIEVPTKTIAACCKSLEITSERIFLKLDIQGGEELALKGAEAIFPQIVGMVVEMPLVEYYTGQALARMLDTWILARGYVLWDINPAWRHPSSGRLDYIDVTYFRGAA